MIFFFECFNINIFRFGCDGAEVIIPGLLTMVDKAAELGVQGIE
jgi:2-oxoglutarate dehydrogenase complex dehydrogenase (E1) component-like enzyme